MEVSDISVAVSGYVELPSNDPVTTQSVEPATKKQRTPLLCWKCGGNHKSTDCPRFSEIEGWPFRPENQIDQQLSILDANALDLARQYFGTFEIAKNGRIPFLQYLLHGVEGIDPVCLVVLPNMYDWQEKYPKLFSRAPVGFSMKKQFRTIHVVLNSLNTMAQYPSKFRGLFVSLLYPEDAEFISGFTFTNSSFEKTDPSVKKWLVTEAGFVFCYWFSLAHGNKFLN